MTFPLNDAELRGIQDQLHDMKPMVWRIDRDLQEMRDLLSNGGVRVNAGWLSIFAALIVLEGIVIIGLLYKMAFLPIT